MIPDPETPAGASSLRVVPLFPLPNLWLFPSVVLPLHVFEERYRQMIEDSLDGVGRLVLGTIQAGHELDSAGSPPIYPVAGLGEIGRHERVEDGRFNILLVGLQRVFVREVPSERRYRKVEVRPAIETPVPTEMEAGLRTDLLSALKERTTDLPEIPPQFSVSHLADMLILRMPLPHDVLNGLYCELDAQKRGRLALEQHTSRPKGPKG